MFQRSIRIIETLFAAASIKECEPFFWYTGSHSAIHSVIYILFELQQPSFKGQDLSELRQHGLNAVVEFRDLRARKDNKLWTVISKLIKRVSHAGSTEQNGQAQPIGNSGEFGMTGVLIPNRTDCLDGHTCQHGTPILANASGTSSTFSGDSDELFDFGDLRMEDFPMQLDFVSTSQILLALSGSNPTQDLWYSN